MRSLPWANFQLEKRLQMGERPRSRCDLFGRRKRREVRGGECPYALCPELEETRRGARACQSGGVNKCNCACVWDQRRTERARFGGVAAAFGSDISAATARVGLRKPACACHAWRRSRCSVSSRFMEILFCRFATLASK